jgi:4-hydroxyphenylpyruvate 3-dimethylallyltransferase
MTERIDPTPYEPARFLEHLRATAAILGAPFSEAATRQALEVFDPEFGSCVVQTKAGCKPGSGLYYRFFYNGTADLNRRAQRAGMMPAERAPLVTLQDEVLAAFPRATRAGLDFDAGSGLAKVWTFTGGPVPVDHLSELGAIPQSVRAHADLFERHALRDVFFVASDYQKGTMNVYFGWDPACRTERWIKRLVRETGGEPLPEELLRDILHSQAVSGGVGMTFSWGRPELLRWCLYSLEVPYDDGIFSPVRLPMLPERLARFRREAPTLNETPQYNVAWSFGRAGYYVKLEKSYARDATYFLTHQMGGDLSHPQPAALC